MKKRKQLKKCSAVLLAISLILSMAVPRIASAEETSAKPSVEQTMILRQHRKKGIKGIPFRPLLTTNMTLQNQ